MGRKIQVRHLPVLRARSLAPNAPSSWLDVVNEKLEHKDRTGWYHMDLAGSQDPKLWYLPRLSDRMKFLKHHTDTEMKEAQVQSRAVSEAPIISYQPVRTGRMTRAHTPSPPTYYHNRRALYPFTRPSNLSLVDMFHPDSGPYYGRLWSLPHYLNPIAGRDRALSNAIEVNSGWSDSHEVETPYSSYKNRTIIKPETTEIKEERKMVVPSKVFYSYSPSIETQLALSKADRSLRMIRDYEATPIAKNEVDISSSYKSSSTEVVEKTVPQNTYIFTTHPRPYQTITSYSLDCSCWTPTSSTTSVVY